MIFWKNFVQLVTHPRCFELVAIGFYLSIAIDRISIPTYTPIDIWIGVGLGSIFGVTISKCPYEFIKLILIFIYLLFTIPGIGIKFLGFIWFPDMMCGFTIPHPVFSMTVLMNNLEDFVGYRWNGVLIYGLYIGAQIPIGTWLHDRKTEFGVIFVATIITYLEPIIPISSLVLRFFIIQLTVLVLLQKTWFGLTQELILPTVDQIQPMYMAISSSIVIGSQAVGTKFASSFNLSFNK